MRRKFKAALVLLALFVYGFFYATDVLYDWMFQDGRSEASNDVLKRTAGPTQDSSYRLTRVNKDTRPPITEASMSKYCGSLHSHDVCNEGFVHRHYKLLSAYVVMVPGYSTPTTAPLPNRANLSCFMDTSQHYRHPKVYSYVRVMAAASQKMPRDSRFRRWDLYPMHGTCFGGQLTGLGAVQSIFTGMHYSERYYRLHELFNRTNWQLKVSAETTQTSGNFQSAVAFLYGLLPGFDYDNLNLIASKRLDFCENGLYGSICACRNIESPHKKAIRECLLDRTYLDLLKKYTDVVEHVKNVLNIHNYTRLEPADLLHILNSYTCQNMSWPCNSQEVCLTATILEPLLTLVEYQRQCMTRNPNYKRFAKITMHGLLNRISQEMSLMITGKSNRAFQLFLGHSSMFLQLITALELRDTSWSEHAASIAIELFRNCKTMEHFIRVSHNGRIVTTWLGLCANDTEGGFCKYSSFQDQISRYFHYHQYCNYAKSWPS